MNSFTNTPATILKLLASILTTISILSATNAYAINPQPEPPGKPALPVFGMIGVGSLSILTLNVLNASDLLAKTKTIPVNGIDENVSTNTGGGCNIEVSFRRADGTLFKGPLPASVLPGNAVQFDFEISEESDVKRVEVRPVIELDRSDKKDCTLISATVEVFDSETSATTTFVNPSQYILINPQPEPPGAPVIKEKKEK